MQLKKQSFPENEFECFELLNFVLILKYNFDVITDCRGKN